MLAEPIQTTLDQGVALAEVEFVVVDLETTGGSPTDSRITEIAAEAVNEWRAAASLVTSQRVVALLTISA